MANQPRIKYERTINNEATVTQELCPVDVGFGVIIGDRVIPSLLHYFYKDTGKNAAFAWWCGREQRFYVYETTTSSIYFSMRRAVSEDNEIDTVGGLMDWVFGQPATQLDVISDVFHWHKLPRSVSINQNALTFTTNTAGEQIVNVDILCNYGGKVVTFEGNFKKDDCYFGYHVKQSTSPSSNALKVLRIEDFTALVNNNGGGGVSAMADDDTLQLDSLHNSVATLGARVDVLATNLQDTESRFNTYLGVLGGLTVVAMAGAFGYCVYEIQQLKQRDQSRGWFPWM